MTIRSNESSALRDHRLALCCALLGSFLLGLVSPALPAAQMKQEYFVRQQEDEALLIRISAYEAEIEVSVFAPERRLLLSSAMPKSRLVPVFQFIGPAAKSRQLDIEVSSSRSTANSKFDIEFTRLSAWDKRSTAMVRAYSLLSFGMQVSKIDNAPDWTVRINRLMGAGATFGQYGMQELRLWSAYLVAHLVQYRLHDHNMVLGLTRDILADTRGSRWQEIELATLQLRNAALMGLRRTGALRALSSAPDPVQAALLKTAELADSMAYNFEKAQAIKLSALDYASRSLYLPALEQFRLALEIADAIGADELATGIRESIAQIHAGQGDDPATNKVLQEIETRLAAAGGGDELALNLLQQGRIFTRNYRYPQAIKVLLQALESENDSSIRRQVNLELAKAHLETGQNKASLAYLLAAGVSEQQALAYFQQDFEAAVANPSSLRYTTEAMYQRALSLAGNGRREEAIRVLERLVDEVLFLRQSLRGVLGAWYWQRHEQLLGYYLDLQMTGSRRGRTAGLESLLVLSKMRRSQSPPTEAQGTDALRAQLAQRESVAGGNKPAGLNRELERALAALRTSFNAGDGFPSKSAMRNFLQRLTRDQAVLTYHITPSAAYVWLGKDGRFSQHKISNPGKLHAQLQAARTSFAAKKGPARGALPAGLGDRLLGPVGDFLPKTVYLVPAGLLMGIPFDALQVSGRYLAERHTVVNLLSFPAGAVPQSNLQPGPPQQVFLAGDPRDFSGDFATRLKTSAEIQAVTDIFRGPGLHIIQGAALLPDEFQGDFFAQADLAHLSMPASIDLSQPERSVLELSEALRGFGRTTFSQADIRRLELQSKLVFLSASRAVGRPRSSISTQAGVASAFLDAGAAAVIAGLWTKQTGVADSLVVDFYRNLEDSGDIASALTTAKRQYLQAGKGKESLDWARYQVFID